MSHEHTLDVLSADGGDYLAMAVAVLAYYVISFLWWGPMFGRRWSGLMGFPADDRPPMAVPMALQALAAALIAYVLWHVMMAFVVTHADGGLVQGELSVSLAMQGAFWVWLGFFVPAQLAKVAWEKAPWALAGINAIGHLVGLLAMALVFAVV